MSSLEKRHTGQRGSMQGHHKYSDGFSDTSSSLMDDTDREVSNLTDRAFRSLCIGEEAIYNDSEFSSSPTERHKAFTDVTQQRIVSQETFSYGIQQYGEAEAHSEMASTFQHSYVDVNHQEQAFKEGSLSFLNNGARDVMWQQGRSSSRVSSLIKAFSSGECYRESGTCDLILARDRYKDFGSESWDKSALLSMQMELSESYRNHFYTSDMATAMAQMDTTVLMKTSKNKFKSLNSTNCFFHSEFSPFQLWEDYNKFPLESSDVSGFMSVSEFPRWYDSPIYKELKDNNRLPNSVCESRRFNQRQIQDVLASQHSRSMVIQKASAIEKRCESEMASNYPPWKKYNNFVRNKLPGNRPSTVSPTNERTCRPDSSLFNNNKVTHEILVESTLPSSVTPFNITQLLTPVIHTRQDTETSEILQFAHTPSVSDYSSQGETDLKLQCEVKHLRDSYKSKASSLLFNLKDNRKRVKSTYSPTKFKGLEITDRNKQTSKLEGRESRFSDILISQEMAQENLTGTDAWASSNLIREPNAANITLKDYTDGFGSYDNLTLTSPQNQDGVANYKLFQESSEGPVPSTDPLGNVGLSIRNLSAQDRKFCTTEGQLKDLHRTFSPTRPEIANLHPKAYQPTHSLPAQTSEQYGHSDIVSHNDLKQIKGFGRDTFIEYSQNDAVKKSCPWGQNGSVKETDSRSESQPFRGEITALIEMDKQRKVTAKQYSDNDSYSDRKETYMQKVNEDIKLGRLSKEEKKEFKEDTISTSKISNSNKSLHKNQMNTFSKHTESYEIPKNGLQNKTSPLKEAYGGLQSFNVKNEFIPQQNTSLNIMSTQNTFDQRSHAHLQDHKDQKNEEFYSYQPYKYDPNKQWHMTSSSKDNHIKESIWTQKHSETMEQANAKSYKISNTSSNLQINSNEFSTRNGAPNPGFQNKQLVSVDTFTQNNTNKQEDKFSINDILAIRDHEQARRLKDNTIVLAKSEYDVADKPTITEPVKEQEQQGFKVHDVISPSPGYIRKDFHNTTETNINNDKKDKIMSKDTDKVTTRVLSYKEKGQSKQEILTSKLKAHAQKEISAIKEKGLAKQGVLARSATKASVNNDGQESNSVKKEITADKLNHLFQDITYSSVTQYKEQNITTNDYSENGSPPSMKKQTHNLEVNPNSVLEKKGENVKYKFLTTERQNDKHPAEYKELMTEMFIQEEREVEADMKNNAQKNCQIQPSRILEDQQMCATKSEEINNNKELATQSHQMSPSELMSGPLATAVKTENYTSHNKHALHDERQTIQHDQKKNVCGSNLSHTYSEKLADTTKQDLLHFTSTEMEKSNNGLNKKSQFELEGNTPRADDVYVHDKSKIAAAMDQSKNKPIKNSSGISQLTSSSNDMKFKNGIPSAKQRMESAKSEFTSNLQTNTLSANAEQVINTTYKNSSGVTSDSEASSKGIKAIVNPVTTNNATSQMLKEPETQKNVNENGQALIIKNTTKESMAKQENNTSHIKAEESVIANPMLGSQLKSGRNEESLTKTSNITTLTPSKEETVEDPIIYSICVSSKSEDTLDDQPMIYSICVSSKCHTDEQQNSVKQEESSVKTECVKDESFDIKNDGADTEHDDFHRQTEVSSNTEEDKCVKPEPQSTLDKSNAIEKITTSYEDLLVKYGLPVRDYSHLTSKHKEEERKKEKEETETQLSQKPIKYEIKSPQEAKEKSSENKQTYFDDSRQVSGQQVSFTSQPLKETESQIKQVKVQHFDTFCSKNMAEKQQSTRNNAPSLCHSATNATLMQDDTEDAKQHQNKHDIDPSRQSRRNSILSKEKKVEEKVRNNEKVQSTGNITDNVSFCRKSLEKTDHASLNTKQSTIDESTRAAEVVKAPTFNLSMAKDTTNTEMTENKIPKRTIPQIEKEHEDVKGKDISMTGKIPDNLSICRKPPEKTDSASLTTKQSTIDESKKLAEVVKAPTSNASMAKDTTNTKPTENKIPRRTISQVEKKPEEMKVEHMRMTGSMTDNLSICRKSPEKTDPVSQTTKQSAVAESTRAAEVIKTPTSNASMAKDTTKTEITENKSLRRTIAQTEKKPEEIKGKDISMNGKITDNVYNTRKSQEKTDHVSLSTKQSAVGDSTKAVEVVKAPTSNSPMAKDTANTKPTENKIPRRTISQPEKKPEEVKGEDKINHTDTIVPQKNKLHGRETFNQKTPHEAKQGDSIMALKPQPVSDKDVQTLQKNGKGGLGDKRAQDKLQVELNKSHEIANRMKMVSKDGCLTHVNNYKDKVCRISEDVCTVVKQDQAFFEAPKFHLRDIKVSTEEVSSNKEFMVGHKNQHEVIKRENQKGKKEIVVTEHVGEKDFREQQKLPTETFTTPKETKTVNNTKETFELECKHGKEITPLKKNGANESEKTEINQREGAVCTQEIKVYENKQPALNSDKRKKEESILSLSEQNDSDLKVNENRSSLKRKKERHVEATDAKSVDQTNTNQYQPEKSFVPKTKTSARNEQEHAQLSQQDKKKEGILFKPETTPRNKNVTRPEISAIADYARLKVISAENDTQDLDIFFYNSYDQSSVRTANGSHGHVSDILEEREALPRQKVQNIKRTTSPFKKPTDKDILPQKHNPSSISTAEPKPLSLSTAGSEEGAASTGTQPRAITTLKEANTKQTIMEQPNREKSNKMYQSKNPQGDKYIPLQAEGTISRSRQLMHDNITEKAKLSHSGRQESLARLPLSSTIKTTENQINAASPGEEMEELQYYTVNAFDAELKPNKTPEPPPPSLKPSQNKDSTEISEEEKKEDSLFLQSLMDYSKVHASGPRSNSSSPAMGKPTMFRVKDNTMRASSVTKAVKPRFHRSFSDDFRIGSPKDHLSGSEKEDEIHLKESTNTLVLHEPDIAAAQLHKVQETLGNNLSSAEYTTRQSKSHRRRSQNLEEEETHSVVSTMSEGVTDISLAFMPKIESYSYRDTYQRPASACYERPGSVCYERPESACSDIRSMSKPPTVPPKSEKALRRAQRLTTRRMKKSETPKLASENLEQLESKSISNVSDVPSSPSDIPSTNPTVQTSSPFSQYDIQPNYTPTAHSVVAQTYPATQRKLLQDPNSGQYFMVDVPLPVKKKTFYDPETGKYVQLNVRQRSQSALTQPASVEMLNAPYMLYHGFLPMTAPSVPPISSSSEMSTLAGLTVDQDTIEAGDEQWRQNVHLQNHSRDSQQYPELLYQSHEELHNPALYAENDVNNDGRHTDIITMSELEDFAMEST